MSLLESDAILSDDLRHRYWLHRQLDARPTTRLCVFVMLNPSTADATEDDPTIRRCIGFARREGFTDLGVVNLWSLRATKPEKLRAWDFDGDVAARARNQQTIQLAFDRASAVVCAWGAKAREIHYERPSLSPRSYGGPPRQCLGTTKDGSPRHPLYVRGDQPLVAYSQSQAA